jgi:glycosyltransferase involved in cell wall biosynthesis
MKIAIQAADLDAKRIDGTRVYIKNLLELFGRIDQNSQFIIYHKKKFNPELIPPDFSNYKIVRISWPFFWTQIRLAISLLKEKPDVLWMPMHNVPYFKPKSVKTVITIHDLAFKYFPECFTKWELWKLNFLAKMAIKKSDKLIAISESSKKDILKFYPKIKKSKIKVIYHGFDKNLFSKKTSQEELIAFLKAYDLKARSYLLYVGAIQPRKNLNVLIEAFEKIKTDEKYKDLRLVLAGEKAWLWEDVFKKIDASPYKSDIITSGKIKFEEIGQLMRGAGVFCFPSLYEGFGLPILEAFAAQVPVVCANNSSLPEVAGDAVLYFDGKNSQKLTEKIKSILEDVDLRNSLIQRGVAQAQKFSWEKCAEETLNFIKN